MTGLRTGVLVGIVSAIGVLLLAISAAERKSPGRISSVHARIPDLDGGQACSACHGGWFGDMPGACRECHGDVAAQVEEGRGLHGSMASGLVADCATCHGEHHGEEFRLVNALAFALAGVPDPEHFDHRQVGFAMDGVHLTLACTECHRNADVDLLPSGGKRFLGLDKDCASCHADPHGGAMQFGCATCHGQTTFTERFVPEHDRWMPLHGAHAALGCRDCHAPGTPSALESLRPEARSRARKCGDCHEAPHSSRFLQGNAQAAAVVPKATCGACHPLDYPKFSDLRVAVTAEQHAHGGFPLAAPHDAVACAMCHEQNRTYAERHPGRDPQTCRTCHTDPHGGQFDAGPFAAAGCVGCHAKTHFAPHEFDLDHHARTAMPLDGEHAKADCARCHEEPPADTPRRFRGTPSRCEQCHGDAHAGVFAHAGARLAANPRGACAECHGTTAFAEVDHDRFDHAQWTGFPVAGAHAQIECADCHERTAQPDSFGRSFGRIAHQGGRFVGCTTCHRDPHEGIFEGEGVPPEVEGRRGCERCHDTASFRALPHGYDHGAFTGWPLAGAHQRLDCSRCHERLAAPTELGRTWGRARGRDCADCHRDPHQGQFDRLGRTDCNRCHKSATSFGTLSFRHNLDSRFPLGEAHAKVACPSCHKQEQIHGVMVARYKPLPVECASCHGTERGGAPVRRRRQ